MTPSVWNVAGKIGATFLKWKFPLLLKIQSPWPLWAQPINPTNLCHASKFTLVYQYITFLSPAPVTKYLGSDWLTWVYSPENVGFITVVVGSLNKGLSAFAHKQTQERDNSHEDVNSNNITTLNVWWICYQTSWITMDVSLWALFRYLDSLFPYL